MTDPRPGASRLLHAALTVSSEARAERVFVELFGLSLVKVFEVGPETLGRIQKILFNIFHNTNKW